MPDLRPKRTTIELGAMGAIGFGWGVARRGDFIIAAVVGFLLGNMLGYLLVEPG